MHDTLDRRGVLLLWYWPRALGTHIHLGYGLPRACVAMSVGAALVTVALLGLLLLAGYRDIAVPLAAPLALTLAWLSSGRRARSWYLLDAHGAPIRYLSATKPRALAGQRGHTRRGFRARVAQG